MEMRVVRHTDRFDEACAFWGELLGWPTTRQWGAGDGQGRGRIFGYGDSARLELLEAPAAEPVAGIALAFEVTDVAAVAEAVRRAGHPVLRPMADQPWGHRNVQVQDPSGIAVTLFQVIAPE